MLNLLKSSLIIIILLASYKGAQAQALYNNILDNNAYKHIFDNVSFNSIDNIIDDFALKISNQKIYSYLEKSPDDVSKFVHKYIRDFIDNDLVLYLAPQSYFNYGTSLSHSGLNNYLKNDTSSISFFSNYVFDVSNTSLQDSALNVPLDALFGYLTKKHFFFNFYTGSRNGTGIQVQIRPTQKYIIAYSFGRNDELMKDINMIDLKIRQTTFSSIIIRNVIEVPHDKSSQIQNIIGIWGFWNFK